MKRGESSPESLPSSIAASERIDSSFAETPDSKLLMARSVAFFKAPKESEATEEPKLLNTDGDVVKGLEVLYHSGYIELDSLVELVALASSPTVLEVLDVDEQDAKTIENASKKEQKTTEVNLINTIVLIHNIQLRLLQF